ncbi:hypothetical protein EOL99_04400, partial [Candidatus Falkowbacteria bacterium]|nr:hypothetical protein [Candidatus Falkowbacteria bacterium]
MSDEKLQIELQVINDNFKRQLQNSTQDLKGFESSIKDSTNRFSNNFKTGITQMQTAVKGFTVALGVGAGALVGFAGKSADTMERTQLKYKTLLGSQELAVQRSKEIMEFAAKTPFSIEDISKGDIILQGFGIRTTKLLDNISNASAISGSSFADLSLIMGQLSQSKDLENVKQLVERGVISFNELKEAGISFGKDGSVQNSVEETFGAITQIMEKKFAGGAEAISKTASGQFSTLKDNLNIAFGKLFQETGMLDNVKEVIEKANEFIETVDWASITRQFNDLSNAIAEGYNLYFKPFINYLLENKDATVMAFSAIGIVLMATFVPAIWA